MNEKNILERIVQPLLFPFSIIYGGIMWLRNKFYDSNLYASVSFSIPVISVGNLTVGGTGKTPHIEYIIQLLKYRYTLATMSRGYKRKSQGFKLADDKANAYTIGDEPMQFKLKFPEIVVSVCEDRLTGIPYLLNQAPQIDAILLDDAFQHRSVKPGLNILISDFYRPFYEDYILPFGRLREAKSSYQRADIIIVSKCPETLSQTQKSDIIQKINPLPHQSVYFTSVKYGKLWGAISKDNYIIDKNTDVILVSGIARPQQLKMHLSNIAKSVHMLKYPDHHYFSTANLNEVKTAFENIPNSKKIIVTTEKDMVRLFLHKDLIEEWQLPIYALPIEVSFLDDNDRFDQQIIQYIESERQELIENAL